MRKMTCQLPIFCTKAGGSALRLVRIGSSQVKEVTARSCTEALHCIMHGRGSTSDRYAIAPSMLYERYGGSTYCGVADMICRITAETRK